MRTLAATLLLLSIFACSACDVVKNTQLEQAVVKALDADSRLKDYKFEVSVQNPGEILVTGEVYSPADVEAVTEVAKKVPGVTKVVNQCSVEEQGSGMLQDTVIPGVGGGLGL